VDRGIVQALALAAAVSATGVVHGRMPTTDLDFKSDVFVPRPEVAHLSAIGFDALVSDYYWMQAIQVVGSESIVEKKGYLLAALIDVVTTLDPWVDHPYRFAAVWLTESEIEVRKANALIRRGMAHHPDDWRNGFYLGFNLFFYLDEPAEAAAVLEEVMTLPGAPAYIRRLVARLKADDGGLAVAEEFLHGLLLEAQGDAERAQYESALQEIATERVARELDAARAKYRERSGRDIERVEELVHGPHAVLTRLPADPSGGTWTLQEYDKTIVSSVLQHRYQAKIDAWNKGKIERKRRPGAGAPQEIEGDRG
jgi:hypothetical protein